MLQPKMSRSLAAILLGIGLLFTLVGCKENKASTDKNEKSDKKGDKTTDSSANSNPSLSINPPKDPASNSESPSLPPPLPPAEKIDPNVGVGKESMDFLAALGAGTVRADRLSSGFVKAIGLPAELPGDKAKGYSPDVAEALLRRVGSRVGLSLPYMSKQVGNVALFQGSFIVPPGKYCLRMVHEGGGWKVDWLSLSSVEILGTPINSSKAETVCQEFTVAAVIGTLLDKDGLTKEDRAVILATGLTPALKKKWAEPLDSDKAQGFDYNRGLLMLKTSEFSTGAESFSLAQQGNTPVFRVEVNRMGGTKTAYLVKLVPGVSPGQWLVDDVVVQ